MQVEIIREEPTTPPVKEVVLRLTPQQAYAVHGLLYGRDWYAVNGEVLKGGRGLNDMEFELRSQLASAKLPHFGTLPTR